MWEPYEDVGLKGSCAVGVYMPFWAAERDRAWGFKGEEGNAQNEKHRCLVNRCWPCRADKSFRLEKNDFSGNSSFSDVGFLSKFF